MRAHVECTGEVPVALPVANALALFTPEGERSWVPGWDPRYPVGGDTPEAGLTFVTGEADETRTWVVARYDPGAGVAAYAYVLPGRRAALIDVAATPAPDGGSRVRVTYRVTSLAPREDDAVRSFAAAYDAMLDDWRSRIEEHLAGRMLRPGGPTRD